MVTPFYQQLDHKTANHGSREKPDLDGEVMFGCYFPEYEGCDCIGCIALICIVFDYKPSMQLGLMIIFMSVLRNNICRIRQSEQMI